MTEISLNSLNKNKLDKNQTAINSLKVNGFTVETNVPADAKFTDTIYTHPDQHPASMIITDANNRFVTDEEKSLWNGKTSSGVNGNINNLIEIITQINHSFEIGHTVYLDSDGLYKLALASDNNSSEVQGVISKILDEDNFELTTLGHVNIELEEGAIGSVLFLSSNIPGKISIIEPDISIPVAVKTHNGIRVNIKRGIDMSGIDQGLVSPDSGNILHLRNNGLFVSSDDINKKIEYEANRQPNQNDDYSQGFSQGSKWYYVNGSTIETWRCISSTIGSAKWAKDYITQPEWKDGLILEYTFDNISGNVIYDSSGQGNNGTLSNVYSVSGIVESGCSFTSSNSIITINNDIILDKDFSISFWLYNSTTPATTPYPRVFDNNFATTSGKKFYFFLQQDRSALRYEWRNSSGTVVGNQTLICDMKEGFFVISKEGDVMTIYKNSVKAASVTLPNEVKSLPVYVNIIGNTPELTRFLESSIDQVRIWKGRAITINEISELYNGGVGI